MVEKKLTVKEFLEKSGKWFRRDRQLKPKIPYTRQQKKRYQFLVPCSYALKAVEKAFKEGYEQAQDDYDIVTERDPGYKYLAKIFENKKKSR